MSKRTEPNKLTMNAPATAATLSAALAVFLAELAQWGLSSLPDSVPMGVTAATGTLALAVISLVGWRVGRFAQRWTYPQVVDPEIVRLGAPPLPPIDGAKPIVPQIGDVPDHPAG